MVLVVLAQSRLFGRATCRTYRTTALEAEYGKTMADCQTPRDGASLQRPSR